MFLFYWSPKQKRKMGGGLLRDKTDSVDTGNQNRDRMMTRARIRFRLGLQCLARVTRPSSRLDHPRIGRK